MSTKTSSRKSEVKPVGKVIQMYSNNELQAAKLPLSTIDEFNLWSQVNDNTAKNYYSTLKLFLQGCTDYSSWQKVQKYLNYLIENYSDLTAHSQSVTIRDFLEYLDANTIYQNDSWRKINIKKRVYRGGNKEEISDEKFREMYQLFDMTLVSHVRDYAILKLMQSTGMRLHEPFLIRVNDFKYIKDQKGKRHLVVDSKQKGGLRLVAKIHMGTWEAIDYYLKLRGLKNYTECKEPLFIGHKFSIDGRPKPLNATVFYKHLKELFNTVGLVGEKYTAHSIRYTAALKILRLEGEDAASKALRHLSPKTIQYYTANFRDEVNAVNTINIEVNH